MKRTILLFLGLLLLGWTSTQAADINLSATNATWKYLDNGTDQGTAWTGAGFDDSAWPSGPAPHGYGTLQIATTNAAGRVTYYYRRQITVPAPSAYSNLFLRLRADAHAQYEIRAYADAMIEIVRAWVPLTHQSRCMRKYLGKPLSME